ncbi:hypothetical protein RRG08_059834 [Elysia crispata]|uniref:Uncharacterized protein n=1 Tax=Elysia crispata TaxID=231223 RepID=A0AAE1DEI3_9GAST|nr:hypothetical protein RRG08_059834 [Elysia crispata]
MRWLMITTRCRRTSGEHRNRAPCSWDVDIVRSNAEYEAVGQQRLPNGMLDQISLRPECDGVGYRPHSLPLRLS